MKLTVDKLTIDVRDATPADVQLLLAFIRQMAEFEKLTVAATEELLREALFGATPAARALLVFAGNQPVGYIVYFFSFSSMKGRRALWLDDLFVVPEFRGKGIGKALMAYLARIAVENHCARFEWIVLDWNTDAIEFYKRLGADVRPDWRTCLLDETKLPALASTLVVSPDTT